MAIKDELRLGVGTRWCFEVEAADEMIAAGSEEVHGACSKGESERRDNATVTTVCVSDITLAGVPDLDGAICRSRCK